MTPSGQGGSDTVARAPQQSAPAQQPAAAAPQAYSGITFKQAFARARERAEQLPDGDPAKYTFYWTNPKTGETKPYQTNYQGRGTRRRPEEPYIPQSRQRGTMSTEPIANPYENPDQFKGGRRRRRRRSTSESAAMMLRMRRHAPDAYGALIGDHGRQAVMEALAEIQGGGDITSRQLAELYILRARKHMDRVDDPHIMENASPSDIARAISHRLMHSGKAAELLRRHGLDKLMDAIGEVAEFHQGAEELGSSDISIMVGQVMDHLGEDDGRGKAYESSEDFITSIRDAVSKSVTGDSKGAAQALDKAKNAQQASNLPIAGNAGAPGNGTPAKPGTMADHIGKAMDASKKGDKRGMQTAIDAAKAVSAVSKANDPDNKKLLATLSESPANGDIVVMELADGRLLQARIAEASGRSLVVEMDETGLQWLDESPDHAALKIGSDGKRVSTIAERWNAMVDDLAHDTPQGWAAVFSKHAGRMGADAADMPRMWGKIWRQQHEKLGDSLTRQDQAEWSDEVSSSLHESAETNGQYMRHGLSHKDPAMLAVWMKSQSGVRGEPVKKFARGIAARSGEPDDAYWSKISSLVSEKQSQETLTDAEDMIAAGFSDDQIAKVTGLSHKHIRKLRAKIMDRPQEYRESTIGYSEPYEVGRKQGMHNIHSNPYSQGSPASQKWSAGHMAAVQGLGEEEIATNDLGREISIDKARDMFGDHVSDISQSTGWNAQFFKDSRGTNWRVVRSPDGRIFIAKDIMYEAGMPSSVARHKKELNSKTPEELHARFRSVADRQGGASPERIEKLAREMAWRHGYGKMSDHYWKQFGHLVGSPNDIDEAVDKAQAERKLRNRYLGGDPKISWYRGHVKVVAGGKEYHHAIHKGQVEDRPYIISDMEEGKLDAARTIDRFFGGMAESLVRSVIRRAGILAMQGRHGEAEALLQKAMRDADPAAAKRVTDAVRNIKPVTMGSRTADTGALEKSAEHNDWLDNTFIPWVLKGLGIEESLRDTDIMTDPLGSDMDRKEALKVIQDIVSKMPERMQVAVQMYMDGSSKADIARKLGLSDTRASDILNKALHIIKRRFMFKPSEFDDMKAATTNLVDFKARMNKAWSTLTDDEKAAVKQMVGRGFMNRYGPEKTMPPAFASAWKKMYRHIPVPSAADFRDMLSHETSNQVKQMKRDGDEYLDYDDARAAGSQRAFGDIMKMSEAKYHGKEVPLGKPIRTNTSSGGKFKVYVRDPKTGNIKMVRFGDTTGLSIKRDDPKRRKSFRARHHCDNPGPRTKARYWSCRMWTRKPVGKILKGK